MPVEQQAIIETGNHANPYHAQDSNQADEQARLDGWSKRVAGWTCGNCEPIRESSGPWFRQEYVRCGKDRCNKCSTGGQGHGPYWYEYWHEGNKTRKRYIGKELNVLGTESNVY